MENLVAEFQKTQQQVGLPSKIRSARLQHVREEAREAGMKQEFNAQLNKQAQRHKHIVAKQTLELKGSEPK